MQPEAGRILNDAGRQKNRESSHPTGDGTGGVGYHHIVTTGTHRSYIGNHQCGIGRIGQIISCIKPPLVRHRGDIRRQHAERHIRASQNSLVLR